MDKTNRSLARLTFCDECGYWKPSNDERLEEGYRGCIGTCSRPHESMVERCKYDFCSRGMKKEDNA